MAWFELTRKEFGSGERRVVQWRRHLTRSIGWESDQIKMIKWWSLPGTNSVVRVGEKMIALQVKDEEFEGFGYEDGEWMYLRDLEVEKEGSSCLYS